MTALPREVTQPQRVSATDLPALLAERRRSGARVVDLIPGHNPVHGAEATAAVVLHVDRHYETIWVEGSPLPALEQSVASWPEPPPGQFALHRRTTMHHEGITALSISRRAVN